MNKEVRSAVSKQPVKQEAPKKVTKEEFAKRLEAMKDRDSELVSGVFKNLEQPGGSISFNLKLYKDDDFNKEYTFIDNERYTIPRAIARHLNNNCCFKEYRHLPGQFGEEGMRASYATDGLKGAVQMTEARKVNRFSFSSLEYMDDDPDFSSSSISEVTIGLKSIV